jgi:hypothetical protein
MQGNNPIKQIFSNKNTSFVLNSLVVYCNLIKIILNYIDTSNLINAQSINLGIIKPNLRLNFLHSVDNARLLKHFQMDW